MPVIVTTVIALGKLKALSERFGISNWGKRESATPLPEDFKTHGHKSQMEHDTGTLGLDVPEAEMRWAFENIQIPISRKWEDSFGGRSQVKAGTKEAKIVGFAGSRAVIVYWMKLRLNGRYIVKKTAKKWEANLLTFPGEKAGINELGEREPIEFARELRERLRETNRNDFTVNTSGQFVDSKQPRQSSAIDLASQGFPAKVLAGVAVALIVGLIVARMKS